MSKIVQFTPYQRLAMSVAELCAVEAEINLMYGLPLCTPHDGGPIHPVLVNVSETIGGNMGTITCRYEGGTVVRVAIEHDSDDPPFSERWIAIGALVRYRPAYGDAQKKEERNLGGRELTDITRRWEAPPRVTCRIGRPDERAARQWYDHLCFDHEAND